MTSHEIYAAHQKATGYDCRCPQCIALCNFDYTLESWAELSERATSNPIVSGAINVLDTCQEEGHTCQDAITGVLAYLGIMAKEGQKALGMNPEAFRFWLDRATSGAQWSVYGARLNGGHCEEANPFGLDLRRYTYRWR